MPNETIEGILDTLDEEHKETLRYLMNLQIKSDDSVPDTEITNNNSPFGVMTVEYLAEIERQTGLVKSTMRYPKNSGNVKITENVRFVDYNVKDGQLRWIILPEILNNVKYWFKK